MISLVVSSTRRARPGRRTAAGVGDMVIIDGPGGVGGTRIVPNPHGRAPRRNSSAAGVVASGCGEKHVIGRPPPVLWRVHSCVSREIVVLFLLPASLEPLPLSGGR